MNIVEIELPRIVTKLSGSKEQNNLKVTYSFVEESHTLFIDKKDIILSQFRACENLLKETGNKIEEQIIQHEMRRVEYYNINLN